MSTSQDAPALPEAQRKAGDKVSPCTFGGSTALLTPQFQTLTSRRERKYIFLVFGTRFRVFCYDYPEECIQ